MSGAENSSDRYVSDIQYDSLQIDNSKTDESIAMVASIIPFFVEIEYPSASSFPMTHQGIATTKEFAGQNSIL